MAIQFVPASSLYIGERPRRPKSRKRRIVKRYFKRWAAWTSPANLSERGKLFFNSISKPLDVEIISAFPPESGWIVDDLGQTTN